MNKAKIIDTVNTESPSHLFEPILSEEELSFIRTEIQNTDDLHLVASYLKFLKEMSSGLNEILLELEMKIGRLRRYQSNL